MGWVWPLFGATPGLGHLSAERAKAYSLGWHIVVFHTRHLMSDLKLLFCFLEKGCALELQRCTCNLDWGWRLERARAICFGFRALLFGHRASGWSGVGGGQSVRAFSRNWNWNGFGCSVLLCFVVEAFGFSVFEACVAVALEAFSPCNLLPCSPCIVQPCSHWGLLPFSF